MRRQQPGQQRRRHQLTSQIAPANKMPNFPRSSSTPRERKYGVRLTSFAAGGEGEEGLAVVVVVTMVGLAVVVDGGVDGLAVVAVVVEVGGLLGVGVVVVVFVGLAVVAVVVVVVDLIGVGVVVVVGLAVVAVVEVVGGAGAGGGGVGSTGAGGGATGVMGGLLPGQSSLRHSQLLRQ